ncbi:hypothetical protein GGR06_003562 [Bacteroides reticulotermitis]|uniref:Uncharacterized protein n=3 Tax=Bacteroides reticulotermitis TaxID=1133319 RepID=W4UWI5_9BACE|nr:hypothetical protein [Bacteroides reticulotermitis]GAE84879.1 hypothetical protein JCM10512_3255 [Bacteroides reticulotermitis JCM 10512]
MTTMKVHEEKVRDFTGNAGEQTATPLTKANAHRASLIRRKGTDDEAIPFHFRKKCTGMNVYVHTYGKDEAELRPSDFKDWDVAEFKHPGYLEDMEGAASDAYRWNSFEPDERGKSDIMHYEAQLHEDLQQIPAEKQEDYIRTYRSGFTALTGCLSRCASPMVTGPAGFNCRRNEKANNAYRNKYNAFQEWRNRILLTARRAAEKARPEKERQEEAWLGLKRQIVSSANTIREIDTGKAKGYDRSLFVSSILNKVGTFASHGNVEIVQRAVDLIIEYNSGVKKPVITARSRFFRLPEAAQRMKEKLQAARQQDNKIIEFEDGKLVWNYEEERLQICFNDIPGENKRKELKSYGFRWSPRFKAWQRQLTGNAVYAAGKVLNLQNM